MEEGKKTLYLHIGLPKTGTSAVQNFFYDNRKLLSNSYNLLYPDFGLWSDFSHHEIAFSLRDSFYRKKLKDDEQDAYLEKLEQYFQSSNCSRILLSSECFKLYENSAFIRKFRKKYNIRVICYLRRQDEIMESTYSQIVKDSTRQETRTFKVFMENSLGHFDYLKRLKKWETIADRTDFIIRIYENRTCTEDGLIRDFLNIFSIPFHPFKYNKRTVNPSLTPSVSEYKRLLNIFHKGQDSRLVDLLVKYSGKGKEKTETQSFLSDDERRDLIEFFEGSNQELIKYFSLQKDQLFNKSFKPLTNKLEALSSTIICEISRFIFQREPQVLQDILVSFYKSDLTLFSPFEYKSLQQAFSMFK